MLKTKMLALKRILQNQLNPTQNQYKRERENAEYITVSRPTAGRTWLRVMIGQIMQEISGLDDINPMNLYYLHQLCPTLPSIKPVHELSFFEDEAFYKDKKILLMTRDPRDHIISYWRKKQRGKSSKHKDKDLSSFIRETPNFNQMIELYNFWTEHQNIPQDFSVVRYEDLLQNTHIELERVSVFFGLKPTREMLERAVEFASFNNMKKMNNIGEPHKVRQGKSGFYKEVLSDEDLSFIEQQLNDKLDPSYGYSYFTQR